MIDYIVIYVTCLVIFAWVAKCIDDAGDILTGLVVAIALPVFAVLGIIVLFMMFRGELT